MASSSRPTAPLFDHAALPLPDNVPPSGQGSSTARPVPPDERPSPDDAVSSREPPDIHPDERFLSDVDVAARYSVARQTVWRWVKKAPGFPAPIKLSIGTTRWRLSDLRKYEDRPDLGARGKAPAR